MDAPRRRKKLLKIRPEPTKSVPRHTNTARQTVDRVDRHSPPNLAFRDAKASRVTESAVWPGLANQRPGEAALLSLDRVLIRLIDDR